METAGDLLFIASTTGCLLTFRCTIRNGMLQPLQVLFHSPAADVHVDAVSCTDRQNTWASVASNHAVCSSTGPEGTMHGMFTEQASAGYYHLAGPVSITCPQSQEQAQFRPQVWTCTPAQLSMQVGDASYAQSIHMSMLNRLTLLQALFRTLPPPRKTRHVEAANIAFSPFACIAHGPALLVPLASCHLCVLKCAAFLLWP